MMKIYVLFIALLLSGQINAEIRYADLQSQLGGDELLFISMADAPNVLADADSASHLRSYHNKFLREPLYDDYLHSLLTAMLGYNGFQHLFKNLGGGFVPVKVENDILIMKGTQDHCGGMEEAIVLVDLNSGDLTSILYSQESFLIHSTYETSEQLPQKGLLWIKRILDAYGTRTEPTRNKLLLRKMAGDWCQGYKK
ncbi:hypothetical protein [Neptuniibacter sp.]|uniref:hypothetical protein n=1 Tax=Neptuniibacter sp. TaxID=1962643 RepID=UPI00261ED767|nr:hypothetical protein [Neptuniibacter sp.]MCP4596460.1 hypothetical protein [Neptuniibacter sp.]